MKLKIYEESNFSKNEILNTWFYCGSTHYYLIDDPKSPDTLLLVASGVNEAAKGYIIVPDTEDYVYKIGKKSIRARGGKCGLIEWLTNPGTVDGLKSNFLHKALSKA